MAFTNIHTETAKNNTHPKRFSLSRKFAFELLYSKLNFLSGLNTGKESLSEGHILNIFICRTRVKKEVVLVNASRNDYIL